MHGWTWLLLTTFVVAVVLYWHAGCELLETRRRVARLSRRVKRLRRQVVLDRLDRLEHQVRAIEDLITRRRSPGTHSNETATVVASYVAVCRSFVQRWAEEGGGRDHADAVVRVVLGQLVRNDPGHGARLGQILSKEERDRWLGRCAAHSGD